MLDKFNLCYKKTHDAIYHLETPDFNRGQGRPTNAIYLLFKNITSIHAKCDVFEKKIDVCRGCLLPPD
jgi:hypothetical protein